MNGDASAWVGAIGGAIGAIGGIGAWIVAIRANGRSERANALSEAANRTADGAYDLQARIDARAQEFRDVRWKGEYVEADIDQCVFRLTNVGHTPALNVTVIVDDWIGDGAERVWQFDRIEPGEHDDGPLGALDREDIVQHLNVGPGFEVHWVSPLGAKGERREPPVPQIFV